EGVMRGREPHEESIESLWLRYYQSKLGLDSETFADVAFPTPSAPQQVTPRAVPRLIEEAALGLLKHASRQSVPANRSTAAPTPCSSLSELSSKLQRCAGCSLCERATRAVPGIGRHDA